MISKSDHSTQHAFVVVARDGQPPTFELDGRELPREIALRLLGMLLDDEHRRDFNERRRKQRAEIEH